MMTDIKQRALKYWKMFWHLLAMLSMYLHHNQRNTPRSRGMSPRSQGVAEL